MKRPTRETHYTKRHLRDTYYIVGEGTVYYDPKGKPTTDPDGGGTVPAMRKFRFSRMGPKGEAIPQNVNSGLAEAMTANGGPDSAGPTIPAGFTYLGQFIDHDLTMDRTATALGNAVTIEDLIQGRSPALDLDCVYGRGPDDAEDSKFYSDGIRIKMGKTAPVPFPDGGTNVPLDGFDLPRVGQGSTKLARRADPGSSQRRKPGGRANPSGDDPVSQSRGQSHCTDYSHHRSVQPRTRTDRQTLSVDDQN